jgi:hypothetical protein
MKKPDEAGSQSKVVKKPLTKAEQRRRFEETARELGCDDGQALDKAFSKIVPPKVPEPRKP